MWILIGELKRKRLVDRPELTRYVGQVMLSLDWQMLLDCTFAWNSSCAHLRVSCGARSGAHGFEQLGQLLGSSQGSECWSRMEGPEPQASKLEARDRPQRLLGPSQRGASADSLRGHRAEYFRKTIAGDNCDPIGHEQD